jgi:GAF domain-containing protein
MKFFVNKPLKVLALYLLALLLFIFLVEFILIHNKIEVLEEIEEKKDFARSIQIDCQQIAYMVQLHTHGQPGLKDELYSRIDDQEHHLKILGAGGRIDNSAVFLTPLSRLPKITYDQLYSNWTDYRKNIRNVLTPVENPIEKTEVKSDTTGGADSVRVTVTMKAQVTNMDPIADMLPGQWLTISTWYERLLVDITEEASKKKAAVENWFLALIIFDVLLLAAIYFLFFRFIVTPLEKLRTNAISHKQENDYANNEIGELATEVNGIIEQLSDATEFVAAIGEGKLDFDYKTLDHEYAEGKNRLADSLISMQSKLKTLNEEESRRQWANEGLSKFVDILRSSDDNITILGDKIISALVKYTYSNQGGLYVLNDDDENQKYLELISMFAFDTKKYETQKVKLGQGILGQTFLEKETTVLNEIPQEYIRITSGLGDANPKSLLIVPLKVDKEVYGIVELASFKNYQPHEITFVEKLAETIASTLASVKVGQKNRHLIEQFQQQTEEMRAQEEEMRQNMEELQATQEELSRKEMDYIKRIKDLEASSHEDKTEEIDKLRIELNQKEQDYFNRVRDLERKLSEKSTKSEDWTLAEEVEKGLRIQLESLKITQEEINKKK